MKVRKYIAEGHNKSRFASLLGLFLMYFTYSASAQSIKPLDNGLPDEVQTICEGSEPNTLYACHFLIKNNLKTDSIAISYFNGSFWSLLPHFAISTQKGYNPIKTMAMYDGKLFVAGFPFKLKTGKLSNSVYWDGFAWREAGLKRGYGVHQFREYEGKLYAMGNFSRTPQYKDTCIAVLENSVWKYIATTLNDAIIKSIVFDGKLFFYGRFLEINGLQSGCLTYLQNKQFHTIRHPFLIIDNAGYGVNGIIFQGRDTTGNQAIYKYDGNNWINYKTGFPININSHITSYFASKDNEYMAGLFYKSEKGLFANFMVRKNNQWIPNYATKQKIENFNIKTINGNLYAFGGFDSFNNTKLSNIGILKSFVAISGTVYYDKNLNCILDSGEQGLSGKIIEILPGPYYTSTDERGNYSFFGDTIEYNISLLKPKYWQQICPNAPQSYTLKSKSDTHFVNKDFAISTVTSNITDVKVSLVAQSGNKAMHGFTENYRIVYENIGTKTVNNFAIHFKYDDRLSGFSSKTIPIFYGKNDVLWQVNNIKCGQTGYFDVKLKIDTATVQYKDVLKFYLTADSGIITKDADLTNNYDSLTQTVVSAIDPNDKQCNPTGDIQPNTTELKYHIRFQNTGSATAINVVVIDTVDANLPLTKIVMNGASHNYSLSVKNNVLKWTFSNIMLPDSITDEPNSHGYISYSAGLRPAIAAGTEITNKAHIYFDYQKPVITNTTSNKMAIITALEKDIPLETKSLGKLNLYPNPATDKIIIANNNKINAHIYFRDITGKLIATYPLQTNIETIIQTQTFPKGMLLVSDNEGNTTKLIIKE